jgi:8-oxo-dGTP pyrophosphatase MutT (NUDIX family)
VIKLIQENLVYTNRYIRVFDDDVEFANGERGTYIRIASGTKSGPDVVIVPVHDDQIGMVRTYRYALGAEEWALPRGYAHSDDPLESARQELLEEMGVTSRDLTVLGLITPDSGLLAKRVAVVVANVLNPDSSALDDVEVLETRWVPIADMAPILRSGQVQDGFTIAALALAAVHGVVDVCRG